jgi:hypothetical protein
MLMARGYSGAAFAEIKAQITTSRRLHKWVCSWKSPERLILDTWVGFFNAARTHSLPDPAFAAVTCGRNLALALLLPRAVEIQGALRSRSQQQTQ